MTNTRRYAVRLYTSAFVDVYVDAVDEEAAAREAGRLAEQVDDEYRVEVEDSRVLTVEVETGDWRAMETETVA